MENMIRTSNQSLLASKEMLATNIVGRMKVNSISEYRGVWIIKMEDEVLILIKKYDGFETLSLDDLMNCDAKSYYSIAIMLAKGPICQAVMNDDTLKAVKNKLYYEVPIFMKQEVRRNRAEIIRDTQRQHYVLDFSSSKELKMNAMKIYGPFTHFKEGKDYLAKISKIYEARNEDVDVFAKTVHKYKEDDGTVRILRFVTINVPLSNKGRFAGVRYACGPNIGRHLHKMFTVGNTIKAVEKFKEKYVLENGFENGDVQERVIDGEIYYEVIDVVEIHNPYNEVVS